MIGRTKILILSVLVILVATSYFFSAKKKVLTIATTTSLYDTSLLNCLKSYFEEKEDIKLHILSVGTGMAFEYTKRGDVDILIVHDREREDEFIKKGYGICRRCIAYNYFMIVGPPHDPAGIKGMEAEEAFKKIMEEGRKNPHLVRFLSRGDASGTHAREKFIWNNAGLDYKKVESSSWYIKTGKGMGDTLLMASELGAYTLTDKGTFLSFSYKLSLSPLVEKGSSLLNVYSALITNPKRHPHINFAMAKEFVNFLMSEEGKKIISEYGKEKYKDSLFHPCGMGGCKELGCFSWKECSSPL